MANRWFANLAFGLLAGAVLSAQTPTPKPTQTPTPTPAQTPKPTFEAASVKKQSAFIPPSRTPLQSSVVFHRLNATVASLTQ